MSKKLVVKGYFFHWAGGTSRVYSPLLKAIAKKSGSRDMSLDSSSSLLLSSPYSFLIDPISVDLPGRLARNSEDAIVDIRALAATLVKELFPDFTSKGHNDDSPFVLFGHSYGAVLAFEIAKKLDELNMSGPMILFVSASRPPSSVSLTSHELKPVSEMDCEEMVEYFQSRGSTMTIDNFGSGNIEKELFANSLRLDYKGLEEYIPNSSKVSCSICAIGGDQDMIVSQKQISQWVLHQKQGSIEDQVCEEKEKFEFHILKDCGHFYLNDSTNGAPDELALIFLSAIQECLDKQTRGIVNKLKTIYGKVLDIEATTIVGPESDFFGLGGSSLDTIALIAQIKASLNVLVTQDIIFLNPRIKELALRISEIQSSSRDVPTLTPVEGSDIGGSFFPASHGQEQMISCWELSPTMYNMPTTIEFTRECIELESLRNAFLFVVSHQPSLRTIVKVDATTNQIRQLVLPISNASKCFEIKIIDAKTEEDARNIVESESAFKFPLYDPPIVRGVVVRIQGGSDLLLLNQHHVGSDGWSRTIFRRQLLKAYISILRQGNINDEDLVIPAHPNYIDWTMWSHKWLDDYGQQEKQLEYWKRKLNNLPFLDLPTDKPRPTVLSSRGMRLPITIDANLTKAFNSLVVKRGGSLYAGLISLYVSMLYRMGGGDDFCIGIALANRHHEGLQSLIGYFANEVAIRAKFDDSLSFTGVLGNIYHNILEGMAHADTAFHKVAEVLRVARCSNRTPVFQAMFALQEREWHSVDDICPPEGNTRFQLKQFNHNTSKFEVHLQLRHDGDGGLEGDLHISTDLFTEDSGRRMVNMYKKLMSSCMDNPDISINCHDMRPDSDRALSISSNNTSHVHSVDSVFEFFSQDPKCIALYASEAEQPFTTYGELRDLISSVARYLQSKVGLEQKDRVGLLVKSSVSSMASIFGTVLAGCIVVILDAEKTPTSRCSVIFNDADVSAIIIEDEFQDRFDELRAGKWKMIPVNQLFESFDQKKVQPTARKDDDVFGVYYTSGSTGMPKGVNITHGNLLNLVNWWKGFFDINPCDNVLLFSSLSFIMSLRQYVPTLCAGGTVVIPKSSIEFESAIILGTVNKLICTPSALAALDIEKVSPLIKYVQVAGETPQMSTMVEWKSRTEKLFIGLGPTELTAHALCGEFDGETLCIGHPAGNVKAYIVDTKSGIQCPVNIPGELWVAGKNVSNGYLNRKELSACKFSSNPFDLQSTDRMYKTGDLAKRLPDGRIQFIGRSDAQLKVNGFRIEAGEIYNAVPKIVKHTHVLVHKGKLIMFVAPKINIAHVKEELSTCLPSYMVPATIYALDEFPLTKNRKLDSNALLDSIQSNDGPECGSLSNRAAGIHDENSEDKLSTIEEAIALIWAQTLDVDARYIRKDCNFFELGGTSLSAVMVSRALAVEFERDVAVSEVFLHQTISSLADFLDKSSDLVHFSGDPTPLHFLPGGRDSLNPIIFSVLQGFGLFLMSIIATCPIIGTAYLSVRSFIWFGNLGVFLFPAFLIGGCFIHLVLVTLCKWIVIGRFRAGKAKKFSWFFLKWWLVRRILQVPRLYSWIFDETIFSGIFLRILGARVGRNVSVEQAYLLEPDLVSIGDNCVAEFEVQFATSEIKGGYLELRKVHIGNNVKLGVRSVILGGAHIHDGGEVKAKATVDFFTSTKEPCQVLVGSPATIDLEANTDGDIWRPKRGWIYTMCQSVSCFVLIEIFTAIGYIGASLGMIIGDRFGPIGLVVYLGSLFSVISCILLLLAAALLKRLLMPFTIIPGKTYKGDFFAIRKWFLDRLFLSPLFSYCSQRTLQTSSTFPLYLRLLGTRTGKRAWLNHPYMRGVGTELISIGDDVHMGMLSYFSVDRYSKSGISFHPISIGKHASLGQRCVCLSGVYLHSYVTVGAEAILPHDFMVSYGGSAFGSPPVVFTSNAQYKDIVQQSQHVARRVLDNDSKHVPLPALDLESPSASVNITSSGRHDRPTGTKIERLNSFKRMQDIGRGKHFWLYISAMMLIQGCLPLIIGTAYGGIYFGIRALFGDLRFELILAIIPIIYIIGSIVLMIFMKLMRIGGGGFNIGTANFFSFRFFYWHIFADMVYLCTSTIIYPFSGTELYCMWLRSMGAKIGKRVFISPENGGFREIDFLDVGDDSCLMTPNIHGHYTDHGLLQFSPVKLESGCEINPGATIMPLTFYGKNCRLRPFAVTIKGQHCKDNVGYIGNPCKAIKSSSRKVAILFGGQGSQYPGMLNNYIRCPEAVELLEKAELILEIDIRKHCSITADPNTLKRTDIAQKIVTVTNLMAVELMRRKVANDFSKMVACAGFSLGEISALCFAGAISFDDTLRLVKIRADAMASCQDGAMCNVRGISKLQMKRLCRRFTCCIANIICDHDPKEGTGFPVSNNVFVCAGLPENIDNLVQFMNDSNSDIEVGSASAKRLRVSAAFHSAYMKDAQVKVASALQLIDIKLPKNHLVYSNVTGRPYRSINEIRRLLPLQITSPVQWHNIIVDMTQIEGINKFIECGPMETLSKTVKLIKPQIANDLIVASDSLCTK